MAKAYWLRQLPGTVAALFADAELKVDNKDALDKLFAKSGRLLRTVYPDSRVTQRRTTTDSSRSHQGDRRPQHPAETTKTGQERPGRQAQETSERYVPHTRQVRDSGSEVRPTREMPPPIAPKSKKSQ